MNILNRQWNFSSYPIKYWVVLLAAILITACGDGDEAELRRYMNEIKTRPAKKVEPIPELMIQKQFSYPENDTRRSPFKPKVAPQLSAVVAPSSNRTREPLEAFPLDALKFVGILQENATLWALIMDPSGLVTRVKIGHYIGQNFGVILKITDKEISIEETVQIEGKWEKKMTTIKMVDPSTQGASEGR